MAICFYGELKNNIFIKTTIPLWYSISFSDVFLEAIDFQGHFIKKF